MLTLQRRQRDQWKTITVANGVTLGLFLQRPTYEQLLAERTALRAAESIAVRLECVTDWRDVVDEKTGSEVPFSRDALGDLLYCYPAALEEVLKAVREHFDLAESVEKKLPPPSHPETHLIPPSADSSSFVDSGNLPPGSDALSPS